MAGSEQEEASGAPRRVLIVGGTGFVGGLLAQHALDQGAAVVVSGRSTTRPRSVPEGAEHMGWDGKSPPPFEGRFDAVFNLSGASVAGKRWTSAHRRAMRESRVDVNQHLAIWIKDHPVPPGVFVSASAVGYYGRSPAGPCPEPRDAGDDFLAQLCADWEAAALEAGASGKTRVVMMRCGVVLAPGEGALAKMGLPFKLGLGGRIATGRQPFPWIDAADAVRGYWHAFEHEALRGPVNLVAPERVDNATFTKAYGDALHRPTLFPVPGFALQLLFGEGASVLTEGQDVVPQVLTDAGFEYWHPEIGPALAAMHT